MYEVVKAEQKDVNNMIESLDYTFTLATIPHTFKTLLPKIYGDNKKAYKNHFIIKDKEKVIATTGIHDLKMIVNNKSLKFCSLGMVSVHPDYNGKGLMQKVFNKAVEEITESDYIFAQLGGDRQRYEYFGFTPSGTVHNFLITSSNIKHSTKNLEISDYEIIEVNEKNKDLIKSCYDLYTNQFSYVERNLEEFLEICNSWNFKLYSILENNNFVGYFIFQSKNNKLNCISEIYLKNNFLKSLKKIFEYFEVEGINILSKTTHQDLNLSLENIAQEYKINKDKSYLIFDYKILIETMLDLKSKLNNLEDGQLILQIENEIFKIKVENNFPTVTITKENPDLKLTKFEATKYLFSYSFYLNKYNILNQGFIKTWFPLEISGHLVDYS